MIVEKLTCLTALSHDATFVSYPCISAELNPKGTSYVALVGFAGLLLVCEGTFTKGGVLREAEISW